MNGDLSGAVTGHMRNCHFRKICSAHILDNQPVNAYLSAEFHLVYKILRLAVENNSVHGTI